MVSFFPSVYDDTDASKESVLAFAPFDKILLHENARNLLPWVRATFPSVTVIYRKWVDDRMSEWLGNDPANFGIALAETIITECDADAYISLNEPPCGNKDEAYDLAIFDYWFASRLSLKGKSAIIGNFGAGYPEDYILEEYLTIVHGLKNIILGFHAYGPTDDNNDLMVQQSVHFADRFRILWPRSPLPLLATEIGPNGYTINPPGWKGKWEPEVVFDDMAAWMERNKRVTNFLGASPYCIGNSGGWENFDINGTEIPKWCGEYNQMVGTQEPGIDANAEIQWLRENFGQDKEEWEQAGGLLDNFMIWAVITGKIAIRDHGHWEFVRERARRRRDSANKDWEIINEMEP